MRSVIL